LEKIIEMKILGKWFGKEEEMEKVLLDLKDL
jgi:ABC-type Fe3+-hydroxamate transport system substrate-binding protein